METVQIGVFLSIFSGVCTAFWTVLTWQRQQDKEKELVRDRYAALYINPFISAAEELQDILYTYLTADIDKIPGERKSQSYAGYSAEALEILYAIVIYFGWSTVVYRYGPYTSDQKLIELTRKISETFSDSDQFDQDDAFYFSYTEQKSLGHTFVKSNSFSTYPSGEHGLPSYQSSVFPNFDSISLYDFEEEIKSDRNDNSALYVNIRDALESIDQCNVLEDLQGRKRLVLIQNYLVDQLIYLEEIEGFSVAIAKRHKAQLNPGQLDNLPSSMGEVVHHTPGRMRLRLNQWQHQTDYPIRLETLISSLPAVKDVRINPAAQSIIVNYSPKLAPSVIESQVFTSLKQL